jgi:hypothetical protein
MRITAYKSPAVTAPTPSIGSIKTGPIIIGNGSRYKLKRGLPRISKVLNTSEITTTEEIADIKGSIINRTATVVQPIHDKWNQTELVIMVCVTYK